MRLQNYKESFLSSGTLEKTTTEKNFRKKRYQCCNSKASFWALGWTGRCGAGAPKPTPQADFEQAIPDAEPKPTPSEVNMAEIDEEERKLFEWEQNLFQIL